MRWQENEEALNEKISHEAAQPLSCTLSWAHRWEESLLPTRKRLVGVISLAAVVGGTPSPSQLRRVSGCHPPKQARRLRYCTAARIISYLPFRAEPIPLTATRMTIESPAAMMAYSIEVAPD